MEILRKKTESPLARMLVAIAFILQTTGGQIGCCMNGIRVNASSCQRADRTRKTNNERIIRVCRETSIPTGDPRAVALTGQRNPEIEFIEKDLENTGCNGELSQAQLAGACDAWRANPENPPCSASPPYVPECRLQRFDYLYEQQPDGSYLVREICAVFRLWYKGFTKTPKK